MCCGLFAFGNAATVNVYVYNFAFSTDSTHQQIINPTIQVGDTIHWVWDAGIHCTTACAGMTENWGSGMLSQGQTFDHTFTKVGVFGYYCCLHGFDMGNGTGGGMAGTVTVIGVTGTCTLLNHTGANPSVHVEVRNPGSTIPLQSYDITPAADGSYAFPAPAPGTYDIAFKASHWLRKVNANVVVTGSGASGVTASLKNGDVNGDNFITNGDLLQLRNAFGSTPTDTNWNPNADLNGDGFVSNADLLILRNNFGQAGDA
jgi:plastocyanin